MASVLEMILQMIALVISNSVSTMGDLLSMFGGLSQALSVIGGTGTVGFVVAAMVFAAVLYFFWKFFISSWKIVAILFLAGLVLIWLLMAGSG
jgi:hypothetical protein